MSLQYLSDHTGTITGVFIPIQDWEKIRKELKLSDELIEVAEKNLHRKELIEAFEEMQLIRDKKLPKPNLNDFLNEL